MVGLGAQFAAQWVSFDPSMQTDVQCDSVIHGQWTQYKSMYSTVQTGTYLYCCGDCSKWYNSAQQLRVLLIG